MREKFTEDTGQARRFERLDAILKEQGFEDGGSAWMGFWYGQSITIDGDVSRQELEAILQVMREEEA